MPDFAAYYVRKETVVSAVINGAISAGFAWAVSGGRKVVPVWSQDGAAIDFIPQTFMICLMSVIVPTILTRRRIQRGQVPPSAARSRLPENLLLRALLIASVGTTVLGSAATAILAVSVGNELGFVALLIIKTIYGMLVALMVTPIAVRAALADGPMSRRAGQSQREEKAL